MEESKMSKKNKIKHQKLNQEDALDELNALLNGESDAFFDDCESESEINDSLVSMLENTVAFLQEEDSSEDDDTDEPEIKLPWAGETTDAVDSVDEEPKQPYRAPIEKITPTAKASNSGSGTDDGLHGIKFKHISACGTNLLIIGDGIREITIDLDSVSSASTVFNENQVKSHSSIFLNYILPTFMPEFILNKSTMEDMRASDYRIGAEYDIDMFHFYTDDEVVIGYYISPESLAEWKHICEEMNEQGLLSNLFINIAQMCLSDGFNNHSIRTCKMSMYTQIKSWINQRARFLNTWAFMSKATRDLVTIECLTDIIVKNAALLPSSYCESTLSFVQKLVDYDILEDDDDDDEDDEDDVDVYDKDGEVVKPMSYEDAKMHNAKVIEKGIVEHMAELTDYARQLSNEEFAAKSVDKVKTEATNVDDDIDGESLFDDLETEGFVYEPITESAPETPQAPEGPKIIKPATTSNDDEFVIDRR